MLDAFLVATAVNHEAVAYAKDGFATENLADFGAHLLCRRRARLERGNLDDFVIVQADLNFFNDVFRKLVFAHDDGGLSEFAIALSLLRCFVVIIKSPWRTCRTTCITKLLDDT